MKAFKAVLISSVLLVGCTGIPNELQVSKNQQLINFANVSQESVGQTVRWGGVITELSRQNGVLKGKVTQYPLVHSGQPMFSRGSGGSFIANFENANSLEPGAILTLVGKVKAVSNPYPDLKVTQVVTVSADDFYVWERFSRADSIIAFADVNNDDRERLERKQQE